MKHWFKLELTEQPRTMTKCEYKETSRWLRTVRNITEQGISMDKLAEMYRDAMIYGQVEIR